MARDTRGTIEIKKFADHHVITQANPLSQVLRRVGDRDLDDPIARAEKALAGLSGEFKQWMRIEADRLTAAHAAILKHGFTDVSCEELFRAAHDIKGDAATFGYPSAGAAADAMVAQGVGPIGLTAGELPAAIRAVFNAQVSR